MRKIDFTFENHSLNDSSFRSNPYKPSYNHQMTQNKNNALESARSTIFSTENKCTEQSFDSIRKELIT